MEEDQGYVDVEIEINKFPADDVLNELTFVTFEGTATSTGGIFKHTNDY